MDEDLKLSGTEQGDDSSNEGESSAEVQKNNTPIKKGRGRPQGSKKLKVSVTDVKLTDLESGISNGSVKPPRGRGRPSLPKPPESVEEQSRPARKRGRPRKSAAEGLPNGGTSPSKGPRKRLFESGKEDEGVAVKSKRGRPKGSLNKKPRLQTEGSQLRSAQMNGIKRRGRPRKNPPASEDSSPQVKRGRGRPKAAPSRRGRPRKNPLPSPVDRSKPKVWKPLGRPRKYPRVDPPEGTSAGPRRSRGRPRKSESKKGAHLRKSLPLGGADDGGQRKVSPRSEDSVPRKRGRPKGSPNKNKARGRAKAASEKKKEQHEEKEEVKEEEVKEKEVKEGGGEEEEEDGNSAEPLNQDANSEGSDQA